MVFRAENGHVSSGNSCFAPFDEAFETKNGLLLLVLPFANRVFFCVTPDEANEEKKFGVPTAFLLL
jgi:hypothetical protein